MPVFHTNRYTVCMHVTPLSIINVVRDWRFSRRFFEDKAHKIILRRNQGIFYCFTSWRYFIKNTLIRKYCQIISIVYSYSNFLNTFADYWHNSNWAVLSRNWVFFVLQVSVRDLTTMMSVYMYPLFFFVFLFGYRPSQNIVIHVALFICRFIKLKRIIAILFTSM